MLMMSSRNLNREISSCLLQNEINNVDYIIKSAFEKGLKVILNPSPFTQNLKLIDLNMLSYLVLNEVEAKDMGIYNGDTEELKKLLSAYPNLTVVLTLGKKGSFLCSSDCNIFCPSFKIKTVDTTAAGDTFTGFFIAMLARGENYEKSLKIASAAAALAVSKNGAAPSIPVFNEVLSFIDAFDKKQKYRTFINKHLRRSRKFPAGGVYYVSGHSFFSADERKSSFSLCVNVISDGSPSRMRIVLRISLGMTTLPRSSIRLTIPVAFIYENLLFRCITELLFAIRGFLCKDNFGNV